MEHINNHFVTPRRVSSVCRWNHCGSKTLTKTKLLDHLTSTHNIPLRHDSMKQAGFCHECSEFFIHEDVWEEHCASHVSDPDLFCGQIVCRGIVVFARKCIFCLADANLTAAERYHGFTHAPSFFRHLQAHLQSIFEWPTRCPHPKCSATIASEVAFWDHLRAVHGIARYKPDSRGHADVAGATVSERDCVHETEMTDTDTNNGAATDSDDDDDDGDGDDHDDGNDDVGKAAELSRFIQGESTTHTCTAGSSMPCSKAGSHVDADAAQKPGVLLGWWQDRADSGRAGTDRKIDQEVLPVHTSEPLDASRSGLDVTHGERKESTDHGDRLDNITCVESFERPLQDVWQAQKPQPLPVYRSAATKGADSTYPVDKGVPPRFENGFFATASVVRPDNPDLAVSRMTGGFDVRDERPALLTEGCDSLILPDATLVPEMNPPQVPDDIRVSALLVAPGVERYPHLRPMPSQTGRACDTPGCPEVFRFARDLSYHSMKVHKRSQHTCHVSGCGKMFRDATRLRDHVRTHSGIKTLVCSFEQCGRTFAHPDTLSRHEQNVHEKEKLFVCGFTKDSAECKMAFDASWKLKRHKEGVHKHT